MSNQSDLKFSKPACFLFILGDLVLLGIAGYIIYQHGAGPFRITELAAIVACGIFGALLAVVPFVLEYQSAARMLESSAVASTVQQLGGLQAVADQISGATARWQEVQEYSGKAVAASKEISERMTAELTGFAEFMRKTNDAEVKNLRLEIEKQHRAESEFIQIIVRILDHTFALHQAAVRSAQPQLIDQLGQFQGAIRDVVRRIGLVPFVPVHNELFDKDCHQSADSQAMPVAGAKIRETVAAGFTYQGRLIRPALVSLQPSAAALASATASEKNQITPPATPAGKTVVDEKHAEAAEEQTLL
jgi:molecular chaperone GrpE (heat shock protein)